jgi:PTS system, N-acetylglucosamine-specific IIBC component
MLNYLQRLGKSLMLPVSIMPIAAILKGVGYWIDPIGWGANNIIAAFLIESGGAIIDNLPILFAVGIAIGMAEQKDSMIMMSTIVSYLLVDRLLSQDTISLLMNVSISKVPQCFESTPNAFIGILVGLISAKIYDRYHNIQLPNAFSLFNGRRFSPIVCTFAMLLLSIILILVWPILYNLFVVFSEMIAKLGATGAGIYAFFNRLLIPTGLHHALNSVFWFDVANINDIGKFWGSISGGILGQTGMYQAGFFPVMMFGLPAAALAMYQYARPENKKKVGAILLSSAIASFLTGVTEPIEFAFMFVAPSLYLMHAILTGIFVFIAASMKWLAGFSFSAGFIDYVLSMKAPFSHNAYMLIPLGIISAFVYYYLFKFMILRYNLMTPGREVDELVFEDTNIENGITLDSQDYDELAILYVESLGGKSNIIAVDSCITRLRVRLRDIELVDEQAIINTGVSGIVKMGKNGLQAIIGTQVDFIVEAMNDIIR